jgi:predicted  nucleic acid-binding Zn-ribbon protein
VSKIRKDLEDQLAKKLLERDELLAEMRSVRSAVVKDNPKKNKWLLTAIERIEKLDKYISQNNNRIQDIDKRKEKANEAINRRRHNQQKYLLGAMVEHLLKTDKLSKGFVSKELDGFLTRDSDKKLFSDYFK